MKKLLDIRENEKFIERYCFTTGISQFTLAPNPTDVLILALGAFTHTAHINKIIVSGIADVVGVNEVLVQYAPFSSGGTIAICQTAQMYGMERTGGGARTDPQTTLSAYYWTANDTNGSRNGTISDRPIIGIGLLQFGTSTVLGNQLIFDFSKDIKTRPSVNDNVSSIVVNLKGVPVPSNAKLSVTVEYEHIRKPRITFCGDSTHYNAIYLYPKLYNSNELAEFTKMDNLGCNGQTMYAFVNNTSGIPYGLAAVNPNRTKDLVIIGYGINDVRTGATSQAVLTSLINTAITTIIASNPSAKIILHGCSTIAADDPTSSNAISLTGLFAGMTLAQAAQSATDIMYNAYQSFANDSRVFALVQRQDILGRTSNTVSNMTTMADQLHPNRKGQELIATQLRPVLERAVRAVLSSF